MTTLREKTKIVIFGHETKAGKAFDVVLLWVILASIGAALLESLPEFGARHRPVLRAIEYTLSGLFALEYVIRLWCVRRPWRYAKSFFGVIDLLALLPTVIVLFVPTSQSLVVIRSLRLLRVFRVLRLVHMSSEAELLLRALMASRYKLIVFMGAVMSLILILASLMYVVEGPEHGFTSIPLSVYWAVVTMTTVGYGDIAPQTVPGQALATVVMLMGYAIIAVPTGIVSVELGDKNKPAQAGKDCARCGEGQHLSEARYCHRCSEPMVSNAP